MQTMEIFKSGKLKDQIRLGRVLYTGFTVGNLPSKFAFIYDEDQEKDGIPRWFNLKGLTYIANSLLNN